MSIPEIIALVVLLLIIGGASAYIITAKKRGRKCIGCPDSSTCNHKSKNAKKDEPKCTGSCSSCCNCSNDGKS